MDRASERVGGLASEMTAERAEAARWFHELRDRIVAAFEALEDRAGGTAPAGRFEVTPTARAGDGGGGIMSVMRGGRVFEKVGVNWSEVHGTLAPRAQAAMAARAAGARLFGLDRVISHIHPANIRSLRLAERMGAVVEREGELLGKPCLTYRHPAEGTA